MYIIKYCDLVLLKMKLLKISEQMNRQILRRIHIFHLINGRSSKNILYIDNLKTNVQKSAK